MATLLHYAWTALAPLIFHWGLGIGIIIIALVCAWFGFFRQTALWVAAATAFFLVGMGIGVVDGSRRVQAKWDAAEVRAFQKAKKARGAAEDWVRRHPSSGKRSAWRWRLRDNAGEFNRDPNPM